MEEKQYLDAEENPLREGFYKNVSEKSKGKDFVYVEKTNEGFILKYSNGEISESHIEDHVGDLVPAQIEREMNKLEITLNFMKKNIQRTQRKNISNQLENMNNIKNSNS